jgi:dihydrofolate reductase
MTQNEKRKVVVNISLSLDGRTNGLGGEYDMGWIVPHAVTESARDQMVRVSSPATTALLGRKNYEGFAQYWPSVAEDEATDPRDRTFARWLDDVEKVVFSSSLKDAEWSNTRIVDEDAATVIKGLRQEEGGDILVLASGSVIKALLDADEVDRLSINLCPELVGGGVRLFEDGIPASSWTLNDMATSESGAVWMYYDRVHQGS